MKLTKLVEQMETDFEVEVFRHQEFRKIVLVKTTRLPWARRVLSKAPVVTTKDVIRLQQERRLQDSKQAVKQVGPNRGKGKK